MNVGVATIPNDPMALTRAWLTAALLDVGTIRDSVVTALRTEIIGADRGFTGQVARVELTCDRPEPEQPSTLIAKFPLAERPDSNFRETRQASPQQLQSYWDRCARELRFYRQLAGSAGFTPRVYGAWDDAVNWRMLLLLEDLSASYPGDVLEGCTVAQAAEVIERIAPFHARWWGRTGESDLAWLPHWGSQSQVMVERFRQRLPLVLERYELQLPASLRQMASDLPDQFEASLAALMNRPTTIIHGDLHLDNLMFSDERGVVVLDWQGVSAGPSVADLCQFIVGSLSVADRRTAEMDLLRQYHDLLTTNGVEEYPLDDLVADYQRALVWQLAGIVGWLARVDPATLAGRERALVEALLEPGLVFAGYVDHLMRDA